MLRIALAILAAPIPAALIEALLVLVRVRTPYGIASSPSMSFGAMCVLLYVCGLVFGTPLALLMRRRGVRSLAAHALAGTAAVLVPMVAVAAYIMISSRIPFSLQPIVGLGQFALSGFCAGPVYWLVVRPDQRRPERQNLVRLRQQFE